MVMYINHTIWRFVKHKPDQYRLLDVRHDVMKNLILGDCDDLIKFVETQLLSKSRNKLGGVHGTHVTANKIVVKHYDQTLFSRFYIYVSEN